LQIEAGEPLGEAPERRRMYPFATVLDDDHVPEVKPGHVLV
jgi:hypothetical protein